MHCADNDPGRIIGFFFASTTRTREHFMRPRLSARIGPLENSIDISTHFSSIASPPTLRTYFGVIAFPFFEMAKTVVPPKGAPVAPETPPDELLTIVSWPPVENA